MYKNLQYLLLLPCTVLLFFFLLLPLLNSLLPTFFLQNGFSIKAYGDFFQDSYYLSVLFRTIRVALLVTAICAMFGLPTAYFISGVTRKWKGILIALTLFPLLTNSVVRSFAWINILGKNGIINLILLRIGIIKEPLTMLYTEFSIIIGSVYLFLPTMIMTMVGVMDGIEEDMIEAAATLGAEPIRAFLKVVLPLAVPGMIVGSILVFTGTMTAYTTPQLLGGNKKTMLATLLYQRATAIGDWTSAGVVAFVMIAITFLVMRGLHALAKVLDRRGGQVA